MTSKNSFWASLRENNKRRIWLWILSALAYVVAFPTIIAMILSKVQSREIVLAESLGETLAKVTIRNEMISQIKGSLGVNNFGLVVMASVVAVVSAIQGFSYLYNKRKIDFYMGMPVKRRRRFLTIWVNGILIYVIPALAGTLLCLLIASGYGAVTAEVFKESILAFGLLICLYLGVYNLAVLAVMLTGNTIITCLGTVVFLLYEWTVRMLTAAYMQMFFMHYASQDESTSPLLSPFSIYGKYAAQHAEGFGNGLLTAFWLLVFAAVIGVIAYACYLKRPAEAAGKAMAFQLPQPFIKILITVPVTLIAGGFVSNVVGYEPLWGEGSIGFVIFTMAVVLIVVSCLIQVLYEFDIRGIFHKKLHILISAVMTAVIFLIFRYDVLGYDTYLPNPEAVSSAAVITPYDYSYYGMNNYFDEDLSYISKDKFALENMYLTDIGALNKLLKLSIDATQQADDLNQLYDGGENINWFTMRLVYRMNSKRTVSRKIYVNVNDPETIELLDRLLGSEEYINGICISSAEKLEKILADKTMELTAVYGSNVYQNKLTREETLELLALYKEDVKESSFSRIRGSIPTGSIRINIVKKNETYTSYRESEIRIYPFYTGCVEYLKERGYYMDGFLNSEDIEKIQVTNYNYEAARQAEEETSVEAYQSGAEAVMAISESEMALNDSEFVRYEVYTDEEDIEALCGLLYPADWICSGWSMTAKRDSDYRVIVYFKSGRNVTGDGTAVEYFSFLEGEVPKFVQEDTVYVK